MSRHYFFPIIFSLILFSFFLPGYADYNAPINPITKQSDIEITSPFLNQLINTSSNSTQLNGNLGSVAGVGSSLPVIITGTYLSNSGTPSVTLVIDGSGYSASLTSSTTWSASITVSNGWHVLVAELTDGSGTITSTSNFQTNDGSAILQQIKYTPINIEYSESCKVLLKLGDNSCPTLDKLIPYDNSSQQISGKFIQSKSGWVRTLPQFHNAWQFYNKTVICVDCFIDLSSLDTMQTVWIEPTGFTYTKHSFVSEIHNDTQIVNGVKENTTVTTNEQVASLKIYHDRYPTDDCSSVEVVYSPFLLEDTLKFLKSGCTKTDFNETTTMTGIVTAIDYKHSPEYQYMAWLNAIKKVDNGNCITEKCSTVTNPQNNFNGIWNTKKG